MYRLLCISLIVTTCAAKPGNLALGLGLAGHGLAFDHGLAFGAPLGGNGITLGGHGLTLGGHGLTVAAPVAAVAIPTAVSSSYRTDVINPVAAEAKQASVGVATQTVLGGHGLGLGGLGLGHGFLGEGVGSLGHGGLDLGYGHGK